MRAVVIYESMFGNTRAIAEAIADGLSSRGAEVTVATAADADPTIVAGVDLLVVGGPTHARGMSRPATRESARETADKDSNLSLDPSASGPGVREWLDSLSGSGIAAAAFDTRVDGPAFLTGRAAKGIDGRLRALGCRRVAEPESFLVTTKNELVDGELDRARSWGSKLAGSEVLLV